MKSVTIKDTKGTVAARFAVPTDIDVNDLEITMENPNIVDVKWIEVTYAEIP